MIAYFDCKQGIAGDMIIASLLDAGVDEQAFRTELSKINLRNYDINIFETKRCNIRAKRFEVIVPEKQHHHRNLVEIENIIKNSTLNDKIKSQTCDIFNKLAKAEAHVHSCDISDVHFHEVGAIDSIIDIIGACICFELLNIHKIFYSKIATGTGTVKTAHGMLPIPAPATAELLKGKQISEGHSDTELATPTGVAIITTLGRQITSMPEIELVNIGYGAGSREHAYYPNILRLFVGRENISEQTETDEISVISFNIDDSTAEHAGLIAEKLFEHGAIDVIQIPAYMKKSRLGTKFEILAKLSDEFKLINLILSESTSFGVRISRQSRYKLKRKIVKIKLQEGQAAVKLGLLDEKIVQIAPEYEDCRKLADISGRNFREVYARILELARETYYND